MQSSVGLAFRAVVMLACLAAVPLLGIYGKRLPRLYKAAAEAYKSHIHGEGSDDARPDARQAEEDAPPFAPQHGGNGSAGATPPAGWPDAGAKPPAQWPNPEPPARALADWPPAAGSPAATSPAAAMGGTQQASFNAPAGAAGPAAASVASNHAASETIHSTDAHAAATGSAAAPDSCTAQFRQIEHRLRELGATYYLLETWGSQGDRYRFLCHMAIAGNTDYGRNRIFQAADSDPLGAMQNVLQQVEDWRAGRSQ